MRRAFTLIELVIVILILGILAGVAARKMFNIDDGADANIRHNLSVVRDAIDLFEAQNGRLPGADGNQATFKSELTPFIRRFPVLATGPKDAQDDEVVMDGGVGAPAGDANPTEGWRFYYNTGVFIVNWSEKVKSDSSIEYDGL
jgi:general secretion pathway protein G